MSETGEQGAVARPEPGHSALRAASPADSRSFGRTEILLLITVLIWAVNFVVLKLTLSAFQPLAFNSARLVIATGVMTAFMLLRGENFRLSRHDALLMLVLGLIGHSFYQILFINGMAQASAGTAALILATTPIFVAIYAHLLRIERAKPLVWAGILLSFAGIVLIIAGGSQQIDLRGGAALGSLLMLGSAMGWAGYVAGSGTLLRRHSPLKVTTMSMMFGTPLLVLVSLPQIIAQPWGSVPAGGWAGLLYSSSLSIALAYVLWTTGIQRVGTARTAVFQNLVPVFTVILAWLVLGDRLAPLQLAGAAAVLTGILLTRRGR